MSKAGLAAIMAVMSIAPAAHAAGRDPYRTLFQVPPLQVVGHHPARAPLASAFPARRALPASDASIDGQGQAVKDPEPEHSGFRALVSDIGSDLKSFPRRRSTWVILAVGGAAAALAHPADDSVNGRLAGSDAAGKFFGAGKWVGSAYAQAGTAVGLWVIGRYVMPHRDGAPKTNRVSHLGLDLIRAALLSQAFTQGIKYTVQRDRPTGECCAFPSGHAASTFATASVLERHLGYRLAWPTLAVATYVAASRLHDNRHFLSDVVFGSALGIATGWTVVGRHGRSAYTMTPMITDRGVLIAFVRNPQPHGASDRRPDGHAPHS